MNGVQVTKDLTIYHCLVLDDVGILHMKINTTLQNSRTCSNSMRQHQESIIILLAFTNILQWLQNTGCSISVPREIHKYLRSLFNNQLKLSNMHNFCWGKINKGITRWANRLSSFISKVLLIQNVLQRHQGLPHDVHGYAKTLGLSQSPDS